MHPLLKKIGSLQKRLARRARATAACRVGAAVLGAALLLGLVDYIVHFRDPGLRILATAAVAATVAWAAYRWWYLPSRRRLVPLLVARQVEARFPQLHDSLASALEFLQQSEHDQTAGSAQLRRVVVAEVENELERLPLDEVVDMRPLRRAAVWLAIPLVVAAVFLMLDARAVSTALARLVVPLGSAEWPRQHYLGFRKAPERLAAGQTFEVELIDAGGELPEEVRIEYRTENDGGREFRSEPMTRAGDVMVARRENVRQSFAFRAVGGDDYSMRWQRVEVIEAPRLESLDITVHPPAYTGLQASAAERHLQVLAGTGIEIHGIADKPLSAARILLGNDRAIAATLRAGADGNRLCAFRIAPQQWIAAESGPYRLELTDTEGLAIVVGQWNLRVEADSPPSVSWLRPKDDLFVTPTAVVPIGLAVKDNLAIHRVELVYERSDRSEAERERGSFNPPVELYRGPDQPTVMARGATAANGQSFPVEYEWSLAPLELPVGAQLTVYAQAADYRPGIGRTIGPRRISIVTAEEVEARLTDRQSQIARQLERALMLQRAVREDIRRIESRHRDAGLQEEDRTTLRAAEINQRRVSRMIVDSDGVSALIDTALDEIEMNRIAGDELRTALDRLSTEIERLSSGPLDVAERELSAAQKTIGGTPAGSGDKTTQALMAARAAEDDVVAALERLVDEFSSKADYSRFARLVAELRADQLAHQESARTEIGLDTLPLRVAELTRAQRAKLNLAAAGQAALAARFKKIEDGMDRVARELAEAQSDIAGTLSDAHALARRLAIGIKMHEAVRDFSENRVGQALASETQIAEDLERILDILRRREERRPDQLVDTLRDAEQRLAELREQLAELREQIAQAERQPPGAATKRQMQQLRDQQQSLRRDIDQLARQLERLQASDAEESVRSAAKRLNPDPSMDAQPRTSQEMRQAEQDLENAARQLAERRQQAEDDLALELVRRFQAELGEMVEEQKRIVGETVSLNRRRAETVMLSAQVSQEAKRLAEAESELAEKSHQHGELLYGLAAVRISLEDAERRLIAATELLEREVTGPAAQAAERRALSRLEGMLQAFEQTAGEAGQNQQPGAQAGAAGDQPPRRPTFELLEVKMLRMLQADLHERTAAYRERRADLSSPLDESQRLELEREAQELAADQGRLAELVETMLTRDNEQ